MARQCAAQGTARAPEPALFNRFQPDEAIAKPDDFAILPIQPGLKIGDLFGLAIGPGRERRLDGEVAGLSRHERRPQTADFGSLLRQGGFELFDIQMLTPITEQLGGITISRAEYLKRLARAVEKRVAFRVRA